ncbi:G-protein coupled receptor family C group 6 member A-like [Gymnodraco acuticeps]|uniref:G-protein coupled receptor family C group 6 member A-like n=1 Tax=Gymnodraco acuticeps TaxID=8218 RepID=A0A6P8TDI6_GYMAC|nr:G-protein coupled receptor family C group 6 member A-like [Gymnodraco acuticeps]
MIYAIREINKRTPRPLPNYTIGFDIYDTCADVSFAIRATHELLKNHSDPHSCLLAEPKTKAVIGAGSSEVSIAVARVLALSSVAQISYSATSELLSRKLKFPTFLRTIPSDKHQTKAIAELVKKFNWKTVGIVGSDDEYGKYGSDTLKDIFDEMKDICIEFSDILPGYFSQNNSKANDCLDELVRKINNSTAEAIILFTKQSNVAAIIGAAVKYSLNRTWIASDTWSTSEKLSSLSGIEKAGEVFGFISKRNEVPGFKDYVISSMFNGTTNAILNNYMTQFCPTKSEENRESNFPLKKTAKKILKCLDPMDLTNYIDQDASYNTYLAVEVIVEGLRSLLKCDHRQCKRSTNFTALELLMEIKKVNFTVNGTHIQFDSNGDPFLGYDILYWNMTQSKESTRITKIGEYEPEGNITVPHYLVRNKVTAFNCSKTCKPGQELKKQNKGKVCCNDCVPCADGEYSDGEECKCCRTKEYSSENRDKCLLKNNDFLKRSHPFIVFLSVLELFGIIVTIGFAVVFTIYRKTPIVKAVGGYLSFVELFSLLACFCLSLSFTGKTNHTFCKVRLPVFGIASSLCISCILANLLQILVGFNFDLKKRSWIKNVNQPLAVVTIVSGFQVIQCVIWMICYGPHPKEIILSNTILTYCDKGSNAFFITTVGYNAFLALSCFLFAFKGKKLPDLYTNANLISISMLLFLIVWIFFIPIYINLIGSYTQAIESIAILISCYGILGCHLAPKCYIMLFRKEINNEKAITEYIRNHYEQTNMPVVTS